MLTFKTKINVQTAAWLGKLAENAEDYAEKVLDFATRQMAKDIRAEGIHNLSGGSWHGGPIEIRRFQVGIVRPDARRRTIEASTSDIISYIMEVGSTKTWDIIPRGRRLGWKSRRKYRDIRGITRLGALRALKIDGKFYAKVTRRGLKPRRWIEGPMNRVAGETDRYLWDAVKRVRFRGT